MAEDAAVPASRGPGDSPAPVYEVVDAAERRRTPPARENARTYLWSGVGLLTVGLVLTLVVVSAEAALDASDLPINRWFFDQAHAHIALQRYAEQFQVLGSGNLTAPIALVFGLVLIVMRRWHWLAFFAACAIGGLVISEVLKNTVQRARPEWPNPFFSEHGYSFPSGHTLSGVTTWVAMGIVVMFILARPWSSVLGWVLVLIGVAMGPSRLFYGVHWLTDVLGGWLFGFGWLLVVAGLCLGRWGTSTQSPGTGPPERRDVPAGG
jgi:membrane-associated phospholipid phosphatase